MRHHSPTTRGKIRACNVFGLHYWADHPTTGCFWAHDDKGEFSVVRWYRKTNEACIQTTNEPRRVFDTGDATRTGKGWIWKIDIFDHGERVRFQP